MKREEIISELFQRIVNVPGVSRVKRNPNVAPSTEDTPIVNIFEFEAKVIGDSGGGGVALPVIKFKMPCVVEVFINASSNATATTEFFTFYQEVLKSIFNDGMSLGNIGCNIKIISTSRIFRPTGLMIGMGTVFEIVYLEDLKQLIQ